MRKANFHLPCTLEPKRISASINLWNFVPWPLPPSGIAFTRLSSAKLSSKLLAKPAKKKQHASMKKALFRLETRFFSSSIRSASEKAHSLVMYQLPK